MGYFEACKAKGIKLSLSWVQGRYWKKKVAGKQLYFKTPNTAAGYEAALAEWAKSQELPEPDDPDQNRPFLRKVVEWYDQHGDPEGRVEALRVFLDAKYRPADPADYHPADRGGFILPLRFATASAGDLATLQLAESYARDELGNRRLWKDRFEQPSKKKGLTINEGIKRFLADQLQKVKVGKRRPSTYGAWADRLKHAQLHVSGHVESINSDTLSTYYQALTNSKNSVASGKRTSSRRSRVSSVGRGRRNFSTSCLGTSIRRLSFRTAGRDMHGCSTHLPKSKQCGKHCRCEGGLLCCLV